MLIFPAILTDKKEKLEEMLRITRTFSPNVHIDITDGAFVRSSSINYDSLPKIDIFTEIHLMVNFPSDYIRGFKDKGARRIIFHIEGKEKKEETIKNIKGEKIEVGISLNPETEIEEIKPFLDEVDMVLIMSVKPGFYGSQFIFDVLHKARRLKEKRPNLCLEMDGGIKLSNIGLIKSSGIDIAAVGSEIFLSEDPAFAFRNLLKAVGSENG